MYNVFFNYHQVLHSGFQSYHVDWTNSGELLAVAGKIREIAVKSNHTIRYVNVLHFYNDTGQLVYKAKIPCETVSIFNYSDPNLQGGAPKSIPLPLE